MAATVATAPALQLDALFLPIISGELRVPYDGRVLFLRARDGAPLRTFVRPGWLCEQTFKPFADELRRAGVALGEPAQDDHFALVLVLPPRQRDEARALFARAACSLQPGGVMLTAVPNGEGAKSAEADAVRLFGAVRSLSKHKCRVFWASAGEGLDSTLLAEWEALDAPRRIAGGYLSRPGLFAWDRIDTASALLAAHLPHDLHGRVADLGAGYGYLAVQVIARCPGVTAVDMYEAERRALEPARINLAEAVAVSGREVDVGAHWHDVTTGLPHRYDAIVSNPPFHQGRADLPELGRAFIDAAADALLPRGRLWLVANRHLPYEATLAARFAQVRTVATQDGFKVIEAVRA
ncbi:class I SAM-dependent methyltransferase [Frateuria sp. MAH-13]|uniref:Class I SAM-dependent methyltransferase n=1 Tax=Frateuria flava TaxID=2821489 RepID=A0ABS4DRA1_9GAMM|nr:class I SAM-dependent methyltransferase [Frateuria flava]MBP1475590.1 class I SAM-dependent methyltransferase [Frateuria flava]